MNVGTYREATYDFPITISLYACCFPMTFFWEIRPRRE